jgi:DNA-binding transcriptional MerR regulator
MESGTIQGMGQEQRWRISDLVERTGVPLATVKYYLREGLLPAGDKVTPRLTEYDDRHLRALGLIRILREVGRVPMESLRQLVAAARTPSGTVHELFAAAATALAPKPAPAGDLRPFTRELAAGLIEQAGWTNVRQDSVDRENLAAALEVVASYDTHPRDPTELAPYLRFADDIARYEIGHLDESKDRVGLLEEMVVGQVVFGEVLAILRRLAEEHHSYERFGQDRRA